MLYAQPTASGFQLVEQVPSVIYKIQKTAKSDFFLAQREKSMGNVYQRITNGFLLSKVKL
jgi:hypothetical protein